MACHWEYAREIDTVYGAKQRASWGEENGPSGDEGSYGCPIVMKLAANGVPFPTAWTRLTEEQRDKAFAIVPLLPPCQIRKLKEEMDLRLEIDEKTDWRALQWENEGVYVIRPNFSAAGVTAVIADFAAWAQKEKEKYQRSPRAKAAQLPFAQLRWLSVMRLDRCRKNAGKTVKQAQLTLQEYRRVSAMDFENDVFPQYATEGAWCKARGDGEKFLAGMVADPLSLLWNQHQVF